jgi:8-amino-7-oxononanoate synthase
VETVDGVRGRVRGRDVVLFCSNDYLGLRCDPGVKAAAGDAASAFGGGSGSSRLIAGSLAIHRQLEEGVADWLGVEAALVLSSGYQANLALLGALGRSADRIISDRLNHASIIDGCRLARADVQRVEHADVAGVAAALENPPRGQQFVVGEGLYSMDGDRGPVRGWADAAEGRGWLVVDEAHAVGVLGPSGRGVCAEAGVSPLARVGTFGKAFGAHGAFVAGSSDLRSLLVNTGRTYIFTTGLPPAAAGAALHALGVVRSDRGEELRARVASIAQRVRRGLRERGWSVLGDEDSPIVPVVIGAASAAMERYEALLEAGIYAMAIRPPTVAAGTCRIRLTVSAAHRDADVDQLLEGFGSA